jgi:hypothetical protein
VARRWEFDLERSRRSKKYCHSSRHHDSDRHRDGSRGREVPNGYIRHRSPYAPLMSRPSKRKDDKGAHEYVLCEYGERWRLGVWWAPTSAEGGWGSWGLQGWRCVASKQEEEALTWIPRYECFKAGGKR